MSKPTDREKVLAVYPDAVCVHWGLKYIIFDKKFQDGNDVMQLSEVVGKVLETVSSPNQESTIKSELKYRFDWSKIPPRFKGKTLKDFKTTVEPDPRKISMDALRSGRGLFITGLNGRGKTHLAVAACAAYISGTVVEEDHLGRIPVFSFNFIPSVEFFLKLKASFSKDDGEEGVISDHTVTNLLLLDDIGAEKVSDWSRQMFYTLIDRRYRNMKQTVITSKLNLEQLATTIDDRIYSRIVEMCEVITLDGSDHRLK